MYSHFFRTACRVMNHGYHGMITEIQCLLCMEMNGGFTVLIADNVVKSSLINTLIFISFNF